MSGRGAWRVTHDPDGVAVTVVDEAGNVVAFIARPKGYSPDDINRTARAIAAELPVIGPGSCPRCHTIVGADQVHVCANVSWRVGEASALRSEVAGAAWDLLEAIANACVESQGGVGYAAEKLRRALEDTKGGA